MQIIDPPIFVRLIDFFLVFLFNWRGSNISLNQKIAAYSKLYSYASVKSVVHWFQIVRNQSFQMYDDDIQSPMMAFSGKSFYKVAKFPTRNITTPIFLFYGGNDSLVDINVILKELPGHTVAKEIKHYEHLDFLWAGDVDKQVFPHVLEALEPYPDHIPRGKDRGRAMEASPSRYLLTSSKNDSLLSPPEDERNTTAESTPLPRPNFLGSTTIKIQDPGSRSPKSSKSPDLNVVLRTSSPESRAENNHLSAISIKASRSGQKRSGSVSSAFSVSSIGSTSLSPSGRGIVGAGGITLGMARPVMAGVSTELIDEDFGSRNVKGSVESNTAAKRKPSN